MSSRVGQVFMGGDAVSPWFALVVEGPSPPRRPGSTVRGCDHKHALDVPVYTLCVWGNSGVHHPVERREDSLASWELEGRRIA